MQDTNTLLGTHTRNPFDAEILGWTKAIAIFVLAVGIIVLSGWALNIDALKRLLPGLGSMRADHAAVFALSGICLYLHAHGSAPPALLIVRRVAPVLVLLLGLAEFSGYSTGWDSGDRLPFDESAGALLASHPWNMPIIPPVNSILMGSALLFLETTLWAAAQSAAFALLAFTLLPLGGYMFGLLPLDRADSATPVPAPVVMGFLMLAVGILVATQNHGFMAQLRKRFLAVGLITLLVMLVFMLGALSYGFVQKNEAGRQVEQTHDAIQGMKSLSGSMLYFLHHNQRFLVTGDESQLAESVKHRNDLQSRLAGVNRLMSGNLRQHERLAVLDKLIAQRIGQADSAVQAWREKNLDPLAALMSGGIHGSLTEEIETRLDELVSSEKGQLKERQRIAESIYYSSLFTLGALLITLFLLLVWVFRTMQYEIAERKQKALELQKFKATIDSTDDAIIIETPDGIIENWNCGAEDLFGYTAREAIGQSMRVLIPADRQEDELGILGRLARGERVDHFETVRRCKDGRLIDISTTMSPVLDDEGKVVGISKIARDITERKQAEQIVHVSEERLRATIETSMDAVVQIDADGIVTGWNRQAEHIFGWFRDEIIGRAMHETIIPQRYRDAHAQGLRRFMLTGEGTILNKRIEITGMHRDGYEFFAEMTVTTIRVGEKYEFSAFLRDITERKESEETIWKQANFDALTGLPNRHMFHDRLEQELKKAKRTGRPLALMLIDIDNFKEINDQMGHAEGDLLLVEAARRIGDCVRLSDTVVRLGGDEFMVILPELDDIDNTERIAQCITRNISEPFLLNGEAVHVTCSIGITQYPNDAGSVEGLYKNADQAMYAAKTQGRNRHSYFTFAMQEAVQTRLRLISDLRGALDAGQFMVYFQPIVDLPTGRINKAEALIRWRHPERGLVSPAQFIPLAEETGLILGIGDWVFQESMRCAKRWRTLYNPAFQVSVNKSPVQFYKDGDDHAAWLSHLREIGLQGQGLVIEITEGLLLDSNVSISEALVTLRNANIQISIDDFGTGYSALSYLKKFDIDYLKIDQSFVRDLTTDRNDLALCEAIIVMAHKLGIKVIAEGVETREQMDMLVAAGCDYGQGYLYSRPIPAEEFEELLKHGSL